jgi:hypothetical protein
MTDWQKKHVWWLDGGRLYVKLITRSEATKRGVPGMKSPKYDAELAEYRRMSLWIHWVIGGRVGPRPDVWKRVPAYAWTIWGEYQVAHPKPKPKPPPPKPPPTTPPTWTLPGPLVESGVFGDSDWHNLMTHGTIAEIRVPGVCPLWECFQVGGSGHGWLGQIEGHDQLQTAVDLLEAHRQPGDHLAIVGTLNVPVASILHLVNVCFAELNAQASWEPYGNANRILFQAHQDGWPYAKPNYGVYMPVSLQDYFDYVPEVWDPATNSFVPGTEPQGHPGRDFGVFSAQGAGDTNSWATINSV